jgi:hypothetical protein
MNYAFKHGARYFIRSLMLLSLSFAGAAHAKLGGHNVVFIHGFQPDHLASRPTYEEAQFQLDEDGNIKIDPVTGYPVSVDRGLLPDSIVDARLNWRAQNRIEKDGGLIAKDLFQRALELQTQQSICVDSCILIVESAGDLVGRHFIENQADWFEAAGVPPFNILATIDFVGAGGGTELASFGVFFGQDFIITPAIGDIITTLAIGWQDFSDDGGVVEDLAVSTARNIATDYNAHGMPRFRISVNGPVLARDQLIVGGTIIDEALGLLMRGANDGVIPAHSSCGSQKPEILESCSNEIGYDGHIGHHNGPGSREFLWQHRSNLFPNYYPIIMSNHYGHLNSSGPHRGSSSPVMNNFSVDGFAIEMDVHKKEQFRLFRENKKWEYIEGTQNGASIPDVLVNLFN